MANKSTIIQLTVKKVNQYTLPNAKLMQIDVAGAQIKYVSDFATEVFLADNSISYEVYETADEIAMLQDPTATNPFYSIQVKVDYTAGTTQTQAGATALTRYLNNIATCATANNGVALPAAGSAVGNLCVVINSGVAAAKVWPDNSSNDTINGGAADAADATTIAAGGKRTYVVKTANNWVIAAY